MAVALVPAGSAAAVSPAGGCSAVGQVTTVWNSGSGGGEVLIVTVTNTATFTSTQWTVSWMLPTEQRLVSWWNTKISLPISPTVPSPVIATNLPYNGTLAPGASTTFGVVLSGIAPVPAMNCATDPLTGVTLTEADNRSAVTVRLGATVAVELGADYRPLTLTGSALTQVGTTGGYPTGQRLLATYQAVAAGAVTLTTQTDYDCLHAVINPCALPQLVWTVNITVVS